MANSFQISGEASCKKQKAMQLQCAQCVGTITHRTVQVKEGTSHRQIFMLCLLMINSNYLTVTTLTDNFYSLMTSYKTPVCIPLLPAGKVYHGNHISNFMEESMQISVPQKLSI